MICQPCTDQLHDQCEDVQRQDRYVALSVLASGRDLRGGCGVTPYRLGALGFALLATVLDFLNQVEVDVLVLVGVAIVLALLDVATSYAGAVDITLEQHQSGVEIHHKLLDLKRRTGRGLGLD